MSGETTVAVPTVVETVLSARDWLVRSREWSGPSADAEARQMRLASVYAEAVLTMVVVCMKDGDS